MNDLLRVDSAVHIWRRLPVIVRAVLTGGALAIAGTVPWAVLVSVNIKHWSAVPWAVIPTALYLWLFWHYVRGWGWPRSTAVSRRMSCRARDLAGDIWGPALFAGTLGLTAVILLQRIMSRLVVLPQQEHLDISQFPFLTVLSWLVTGALVAGIVEEASFRGYIQGPIERRHGPVIAILVTGTLFGFAHFTHPEVALILMPYYLAVAAVYGALAYFTNSILPSIVLHTGGNILTGLDLFTRGSSEWQAPTTATPLILETGTDGMFWVGVMAFVIVGTATVWSFRILAGIVGKPAAPARG